MLKSLWKRHSAGAGSVAAATVLGAVLSFLTHWLLATYYGPDRYGAFSAAWSATQVVVPFSVLGISQFLIQHFHREGPRAVRWVKPAMATVFGLTLLACAGYVIWTILLVGDALTSEIASWLVLWVFLAPPVVMVYARFQLLHDVWWMVAWPLLQLVPRVLVTTLAVFVGAPLWLIPAGFVVVLAPMSMYAWRLIRLMGAPEFSRIFHRNKRMRDSQLPATPRSLLKRTWAYGASEVLENIDLKLIIPLTAAIAGERHTGYLSTVVIVLTAMHIVPWAVVQRYFLSRLHQLGVQAPRQLRWYMKRVALLLALVGLMAAPMVWYWSDEIVYLVYGEKYVPSGEVLRALSFAIPVWLLSLPVASMFLAVHMIKRLVISQMLALIILVLAGLQFIPEYGAVGAAWALLAGRVGLLVIAGTWLWLVGPNQK